MSHHYCVLVQVDSTSKGSTCLGSHVDTKSTHSRFNMRRKGGMEKCEDWARCRHPAAVGAVAAWHPAAVGAVAACLRSRKPKPLTYANSIILQNAL